jgi:hypothetical protein
MQTRWVSLLIAVLAVTFTAGSAHATDERLLVVVESTPGAGIDPREVRQTVEAELGVPVIAPGDATAAEASNVLIVEVDKADIRMSLRGSAAGLVGRTIPAPLDRPTRLREIAWLAGNLARDQVSGIVAVPAARPTAAHATDIAAVDLPPAIETPPAASPSNLAAVPAPSPEPAATVKTNPPQSGSQGSLWSVTAAFGPSADKGARERNGSGSGATIFTGNTAFQIEVERASTPSRLSLGVALDAGTDSNGFGVAGFIGSSWRPRRFFLETTGGLGLELARIPQTVVTSSSLTGVSSMTTTGIQALPFLRGEAEVGLAITSYVALVARFGVHVAFFPGGWSDDDDTISGTLGVRVGLP